MEALEGYYDGKSIKVFDKINAQRNQRIVVTVLDEFIDEKSAIISENKKTARGILAKYAKPQLIKYEKEAFEKAMVDKHAVD